MDQAVDLVDRLAAGREDYAGRISPGISGCAAGTGDGQGGAGSGVLLHVGDESISREPRSCAGDRVSGSDSGIVS